MRALPASWASRPVPRRLDHDSPTFGWLTKYLPFNPRRCKAQKGEDDEECEKYAKYYRSLCPTEWVTKWNEEREAGTWPGRY